MPSHCKDFLHPPAALKDSTWQGSVLVVLRTAVCCSHGVKQLVEDGGCSTGTIGRRGGSVPATAQADENL